MAIGGLIKASQHIVVEQKSEDVVITEEPIVEQTNDFESMTI